MPIPADPHLLDSCCDVVIRFKGHGSDKGEQGAIKTLMRECMKFLESASESRRSPSACVGERSATGRERSFAGAGRREGVRDMSPVESASGHSRMNDLRRAGISGDDA